MSAYNLSTWHLVTEYLLLFERELYPSIFITRLVTGNSSVIDNYDTKKRNSLSTAILYAKMDVQITEVKDLESIDKNSLI